MADFNYRTSFYVDQNTPDPTKLFNDARRRCFLNMEQKMEFDRSYKVKLDLIVTDFADTDSFFQVKTLRVVAKDVTDVTP